MNTIQIRFLMFLVGCIGTRLLFSYLAKIANKKILKIMGLLALIPAIAWIYLYFTNGRKTGPEVFGDVIWWNNLRIVHALIYILFSIYALQNKHFAWFVLFVDALFGLTAFIYYHSSNGNIFKLFQ